MLAQLREGPKHTRELTGRYLSYDATHAKLARLEKRGFVERLGRSDGVTVWVLTGPGLAIVG